jgi:hypothetical protein
LSSAGTAFGVKNTSSGEVVVADDQDMTASGTTGIYVYDALTVDTDEVLWADKGAADNGTLAYATQYTYAVEYVENGETYHFEYLLTTQDAPGADEPRERSYSDLETRLITVFSHLDNNAALLSAIISDGYQMFLYPPPVPVDGHLVTGYEWSFLQPMTDQLTTYNSYSTGTIEVTVDDATVTLSDGTWPAWIDDQSYLTIDGSNYLISSRTSDTEIELDADWAGDTEDTLSYTAFLYPWRMDLPSDFGWIAGGQLWIDSDSVHGAIDFINPRDIMQRRLGLVGTGTPRYAAVRPKAFVEGTGQRWQLIIHPPPDQSYTIDLPMVVAGNMMTDDNYGRGGAVHSLTLLYCMYAMAEVETGGGKAGQWNDRALGRLATSIKIDMRQKSGRRGYCGDRSDGAGGGTWPPSIIVTEYEGTSIDLQHI